MLNFIKGLKIKTKIISIVVILLIILMIVANIQQGKKKAAVTPTQTTTAGTEADTLSDAEVLQQSLIKKFGEPTDGFRWDSDGSRIPLGNSDLTAEEIAYQYVKAVSMLDFETAEKYSTNTTIPQNYEDFYDVDNSDSYYNQFSRKIYKAALLSIVIDKVVDSARFAGGKTIITFSITMYDLSNKTFWEPQANEIFDTLYDYSNAESDTTKAEQYVYGKILDYYQSGTAVTKTVQVDVVLDKVNLGGWLVSNDMDLYMLCSYSDGTSVYEYIMDQYADYSDSKSDS